MDGNGYPGGVRYRAPLGANKVVKGCNSVIKTRISSQYILFDSFVTFLTSKSVQISSFLCAKSQGENQHDKQEKQSKQGICF